MINKLFRCHKKKTNLLHVPSLLEFLWSERILNSALGKVGCLVSIPDWCLECCTNLLELRNTSTRSSTRLTRTRTRTVSIATKGGLAHGVLRKFMNVPLMFLSHNGSIFIAVSMMSGPLLFGRVGQTGSHGKQRKELKKSEEGTW